MKRLVLFAKTCHSYWLWLTTELQLYKLWLFSLLISVICIETIHILPSHWGKTPWHGIMIVFASLTGAMLGTTFYITVTRGIIALEKRLPWFLPTVVICLMVGISALVIKEKGLTHVWTGFLNEVLKPLATSWQGQ